MDKTIDLRTWRNERHKKAVLEAIYRMENTIRLDPYVILYQKHEDGTHDLQVIRIEETGVRQVFGTDLSEIALSQKGE